MTIVCAATGLLDSKPFAASIDHAIRRGMVTSSKKNCPLPAAGDMKWTVADGPACYYSLLLPL